MAKLRKKNKNRLNCVLVKPAILHFIPYPGCLSFEREFWHNID
jgi:hypothetical protein